MRSFYWALYMVLRLAQGKHCRSFYLPLHWYCAACRWHLSSHWYFLSWVYGLQCHRYGGLISLLSLSQRSLFGFIWKRSTVKNMQQKTAYGLNWLNHPFEPRDPSGLIYFWNLKDREIGFIAAISKSGHLLITKGSKLKL